MSLTIDQAFIKQFEADVHLQYQQNGTKLRNTVRVKNGIMGASTTFQKVGKGTATTKTRNGVITPMNVTHEPKECVLSDFYAGDWVDAMDELKTNIDERRVIASAGAYALGRKTDELIISALKTGSTTVIASENIGLTKSKIMEAVEKLNTQAVPDDGQRYGIIGVKQFTELLNTEEFSSSNYNGEDLALINGCEARKWMGIVWVLHNDLPLTESNERECFIYHKTAIGHAVGSEIKTDISWAGDRAAHFVSSSMSQGSCVIDTTGIVKILCKDGE